MAKTTGLRRYFGAESGNVLLGQLGFDVIPQNGVMVAGVASGVGSQTVGALTGQTTTKDGSGVNCWVTLLCLDDGGDAIAGISATSQMGDDLEAVTIGDAVAISGVFTAIKHTHSGGIILAYRG